MKTSATRDQEDVAAVVRAAVPEVVLGLWSLGPGAVTAVSSRRRGEVHRPG
jgi:hypothetical protein